MKSQLFDLPRSRRRRSHSGIWRTHRERDEVLVMRAVTYRWNDDGTVRAFDLVRVERTDGGPYSFGDGAVRRPVEVQILDRDRPGDPGPVGACRRCPKQSGPPSRGGPARREHLVGRDHRPGGFLYRLNEGPVRRGILAQLPADGVFRLPSEAEWEYAARGGPHWRDGFRYSGGNDIDAVAWYDRRHGDHTQRRAESTEPTRHLRHVGQRLGMVPGRVHAGQREDSRGWHGIPGSRGRTCPTRRVLS